MIIVLGLIFIPGVYAWLNIDSNWGPYDNTGNIPIAVVNEDEGATILGEEINIGNEIKSSLAQNDAMKWIFTDQDEAISSVEQSKYYGAIIIPKDFSKHLVSILGSDQPEKPKFDFYVNNKKNPIAPIIVNKAVGAIQNSVNQTFVNTVAYKMMGAAEDLDAFAKSSGIADGLIEKLEDAKTKVQQLRIILKTTNLAMDATDKSILAIREILPTIDGLTDTTKQGLTEIKNVANSFNATYKEMEEEISSLINNSETNAEEFSEILSKINSGNVIGNVTSATAKLDELSTNLKKLDEVLASIDEATQLPEIQTLREKISQTLTDIENLKNLMTNTAEALSNLSEIKTRTNNISQKLTALEEQYQNTVKGNLNNLYQGASRAVDQATNVMLNLNTSLDNVNSSMKYMMEALESGGELMENVDVILENFQTDIDKMIGVVKEAKSSELYQNIANLLKNNPEEVASFLSTPVETNEIEVYPIKTYGSEMAPFYSVLACWVGCTILAAILKVDIKKTKTTADAKNYQKFFGRFLLFAGLAMCQGLMIGIGDLILQVQTVNWCLFLVTLMLSSLVFILIIYSLVAAFGKIGQAISIVIMVLQIAGSGGTFPIELLPRLFQVLQPYMPFYPAMNALRETIGGFYQNNYLMYMLMLLCHTILPLLLGLALSKYTAKIKSKLQKELHATDILG